ncbi:AAA family ATPase [Amycolatopsis bartoniae]|uniref:Helix-turn-helix transcriptional regulator n=2 Tax=Amycolatopsis bartoniae TaxID=941986 RepID=A0A8H9IR71_9PSEU|nr:LuxR family transcriptional regulator [Amycolatopsis bartoniae]TVT08229.1 AAA family ATPase [Amycolatopsis bartoniae]GHF39873.1 helix-turn-helix transcriptional regulator [Amycolatopsis bartoniae]
MTRPLRGRADELTRGLSALRTARGGRSVVTVVNGEPGIGKSALVQAIGEQAGRQGFAVAESQAHETDDVTPLASLGPALRFGAEPLLTSAEFLELAGLTAQPLWLAEHLATFLEYRARDRPVLLVLDDAQWTDPLSTFTLRILPKRLRDSPVAWLLATRPAPGGPAEQVAEAAGPQVPVVRIAPPPLAVAAVLEIAADRLGEPAPEPLARQLAGVGGNPFLAVQLIEGMFDPAAGATGTVPAGLLHGVRRRLAGLSPQCRDLVRVAAVLGPAGVLADAAHLLGTAAALLTEPLGEALAAGLLTDDGTHLGFRHALLRDAVYEDIPPSARHAWHRQIADHFRVAGRGWAVAAPHVLAVAGPGDTDAVEVLRRAAHEVLETMSVTSATFIRHAFDLTLPGDPLRGPLGADVVGVLIRARDHAGATRFADALLSEVDDPDVVATVRLQLLPRLWSVGDRAELARRAEGVAGATAELSARLAEYRAIATGEPVDPGEDETARALAEIATAERTPSFAVAAESYARARKALPGAAGMPGAGDLELRELLARARLDDLDGALAGLASYASDSWLAPQAAWLRAVVCRGAGRLDEAAEHAEQSLRLLAEVHEWHLEGRVRAVLAELALLRGEANGDVGELDLPWPEERLVHVAHAEDERLVALARENPGVASVQGAAALVTGDPARAVELLRTVPRPLLLARAEEELGRTLLASGDRATAIPSLDSARDRFAALGAAAPALRVQRVLHAAGVRRRRWAAVPQRPEHGWDALTAMERRVALLVADGHTNRSAAAALSVSPSTVGTHLRAVFGKLGVHSRVQLAKVVLERDS